MTQEWRPLLHFAAVRAYKCDMRREGDVPPELRGVEERLRSSRARFSPTRLEELKDRAMAQAARVTGGPAPGSRRRRVLTGVLVLGVLGGSGASGVIAARGPDGSQPPSAASSQYQCNSDGGGATPVSPDCEPPPTPTVTTPTTPTPTITTAPATTTVQPPPQLATGSELVVGCARRRLVLIDVVPAGRRVRLYGAADKTLAGQVVNIVFQATNKVVARPVVGADGFFTATAPLPPRRLRGTNVARYVARLAQERSLNLKLARRMRVTGIRNAGGQVTIAGRVTAPRARAPRDRVIVLKRRVECGRYEVVGRTRYRADGRYRITVKAPADVRAAVYRLQTKVHATPRRGKLFPTFTLPRAIDF